MMSTKTMRTRTLLSLTLLGALLAGGTLDAKPALAQDVQVTGPLAGADAVRRLRIYRASRIHVQPFAAATLQDEFSRTILFGGQITYHLTDWLGIGVWGAFGGIHIDTGLTDQISERGQTTDRNQLSLPSRRGFANQIGEIAWAAAGQLTFIPLRGKLSLFQKLFVDADFYLVGGVGLIGVNERPETDAAACMVTPDGNPIPGCNQNNSASRLAIAPTFGAGISLYFNEFLALTFEWRGMPFAWNTSGTDESGGAGDGDFPDDRIDSNDRIFHLNTMVSLGLAIYLPTAVAIGD